jgi:APA family basic amino acid/polyamine antiporter
MTRVPEASTAGTLPRGRLGVIDASLLVVGSMVGAGIFLMGPYVAQQAVSPVAFVGTWVLGGVVAMSGALSNGELGGLFPRSGGEYLYLREAYGPCLGFLSGWTSFWIAFPGSIAALASGFGTAVADLMGVKNPHAATAVGVAAIGGLTILNALGLRPGKWVQNTLSASKLAAFAALLALGAGVSSVVPPSSPPASGSAPLPLGMAMALVPAMFAYSGWNAATYIAGEMSDPARGLGRALAIGTLICTVLYVLVNLSYMRAMPLSELAAIADPARLTAMRLGGPKVAALLGPLVAVCILSSLQATVQVGPHLYRAMAVDRVFFRWLGLTHAGTRAPVAALGAQAGIAIAELVSNRFDQLITLVMVPLILFSTLTVGGVLVLRTRRPDSPRPFRVPGYPLVPALFIAVNAWVLWSVLGHDVKEALGMGTGGAMRPPGSWRVPTTLVGAAIVATGIPVYYAFRAHVRAEEPIQ